MNIKFTYIYLIILLLRCLNYVLLMLITLKIREIMNEVNILLIEGNNDIKNTINVALSKAFSLNITSTGGGALKILSKDKTDIIILDLNIQDVGGAELCREIRDIGVLAPIFILTSNPDLKAKLELFKLGADDVIVKPFSLGELEARLNVHKNRILN